MGLGNSGTTTQTAINYIMFDAFLFIMCIFLYNLFVGIAVDQVGELVEKGRIHLIKERIDYIQQVLSFLSFWGFSDIIYFNKQVMWQYNNEKCTFVRKFMNSLNKLYYKITNANCILIYSI